MAIFNLEEIVEGWTGGQGSPSTTSKTGAGAAIGSAVGSIIPGLGTVIGGAIGGVLSYIGIRGKTPRLDYDGRARIAATLATPIVQELDKAGYFHDPLFREIFKRNYIQFVGTSNPGEAFSRPEFLNRNDLSDVPVWLAFMYSLQGVSTDPNDTTGVRYRIDEVINKLLLPSVREYESQKGITSGSFTFKIDGNGNVQTGPAGPPALLWLAGLAVVGAFVFGFVRFK